MVPMSFGMTVGGLEQRRSRHGLSPHQAIDSADLLGPRRPVPASLRQTVRGGSGRAGECHSAPSHLWAGCRCRQLALPSQMSALGPEGSPSHRGHRLGRTCSRLPAQVDGAVDHHRIGGAVAPAVFAFR